MFINIFMYIRRLFRGQLLFSKVFNSFFKWIMLVLYKMCLFIWVKKSMIYIVLIDDMLSINILYMMLKKLKGAKKRNNIELYMNKIKKKHYFTGKVEYNKDAEDVFMTKKQTEHPVIIDVDVKNDSIIHTNGTCSKSYVEKKKVVYVGENTKNGGPLYIVPFKKVKYNDIKHKSDIIESFKKLIKNSKEKQIAVDEEKFSENVFNEVERTIEGHEFNKGLESKEDMINKLTEMIKGRLDD